MTIEEYEQLAGISISESQTTYVEAQIARTKRILESLLGYTLTSDSIVDNVEIEPRLDNFYEEIGQTSSGLCSCSNIQIENLNPPDEVMYGYRLYQVHRHDKYLYVDPFTSLNKVKLVKDGVTFKTFEEEDIRVDYQQNGIAKYIELCDGCSCDLKCEKECVQLAVDADWCFAEVPDDLNQVWVDMITFYSDKAWNIKSQTVLGHSYTKNDNVPPEQYSYNKIVIQRYAGPYGMVARIPTV